jgi:hypothetical protein
MWYYRHMSNKPSPLPPLEVAKQHFKYCPESGQVIRLKGTIRSNGRPHTQGVNRPVGTKTSNGYLYGRLTHNKTHYGFLVHRLAWLLHTGKEPTNQIDHISGIRDDNRACNLREATNRENQCNRHQKVGKDKDLPIGVYRRKRPGRPGIWYVSALWFNGLKKTTLSRSLDSAIQKRKQWENEYFHAKAV